MYEVFGVFKLVLLPPTRANTEEFTFLVCYCQ